MAGYSNQPKTHAFPSFDKQNTHQTWYTRPRWDSPSLEDESSQPRHQEIQIISLSCVLNSSSASYKTAHAGVIKGHSATMFFWQMDTPVIINRVTHCTHLLNIFPRICKHMKRQCLCQILRLAEPELTLLRDSQVWEQMDLPTSTRRTRKNLQQRTSRFTPFNIVLQPMDCTVKEHKLRSE